LKGATLATTKAQQQESSFKEKDSSAYTTAIPINVYYN